MFLFSGDLRVGNDKNGKGGEVFRAPTYAVRPPGAWHGPVTTDQGCFGFEIHYYDEAERPK